MSNSCPKQGIQNGYKTIDVAFSGLLQNPNQKNIQNDLRVNVFKKFYFSLLDIKLAKKRRFKHLNIVFNARPRNPTVWKAFNIGWKIAESNRKLARLVQYRKYNDEEYFNLLAKSKIVLNTLSPMGLVGTRYYESMASKALVFCEESSIYSKIFMDKTYMTFKTDLSDFEEKLLFILENPQMASNIVERAYKHVMEEHTWRDRIKFLLKEA